MHDDYLEKVQDLHISEGDRDKIKDNLLQKSKKEGYVPQHELIIMHMKKK